MLAHLAANCLSPNGYVCFNGDVSVFTPSKSFKSPFPFQIAKSVIHKQGMDLATDREDEELIYGNACVNVLLHEPMINERDRKSATEMKIYNRKLEGIAKLLKYWASGDNRPENGSFVGFDFSRYKNASVVLPKYF
jgi:hypothetical protein